MPWPSDCGQARRPVVGVLKRGCLHEEDGQRPVPPTRMGRVGWALDTFVRPLGSQVYPRFNVLIVRAFGYRTNRRVSKTRPPSKYGCARRERQSMRECTFNYYLEINRNTPSPYRSNVSRMILRTISTLNPFGRRQTSGLSVIFCRQSWNTSVKLR